MKVFVKENESFNTICHNGKILRNQHYDFEIEEGFEEGSIDIVLGDNGVGKSLFIQIICLVGYIYHYNQKTISHSDRYVNDVVGRLASLNIGSIKQEVDLSESDKRGIHFVTSVRPKENQGERNFIDLKVDDCDPLWVKDDYHFCIKIGPLAETFFKDNNILYYSNSQFPNNETFFSPNVLSLRASDIDKLFLLAMDSSIYGQFGRTDIDISLNKTNPFIDLEKELESIQTREYISTRANNFMHHYSVNRDYKKQLEIFHKQKPFYGGNNDDNTSKNAYEELLSEIQNCTLYKKIQEWVYGPLKNVRKMPHERISAEKFSIFDYFYAHLLKSKELWFYIDLVFDGVKIDYLNSGKQYEITLESINHLVQHQNNLIFFIDEPENSQHIKIQEDLLNKTPSNHRLVLLSHSPFLVRSLRKDGVRCTIFRFRRDSSYQKKLLIDTEQIEYDSIDDISAEYFAHSPVIDRWNELNTSISPDNYMSMDEFYKKLDQLKEEIGK